MSDARDRDDWPSRSCELLAGMLTAAQREKAMTSTVSPERLESAEKYLVQRVDAWAKGARVEYDEIAAAADRINIAALRELRALRQGDMVLVPREPTDQMITAMFRVDWMAPGASLKIYRAMLAAAEKEKLSAAQT